MEKYHRKGEQIRGSEKTNQFEDKRYVFSVVLEDKEYYLSEFFLDFALGDDSELFDVKINNIIKQFSNVSKTNFMIVLKVNYSIINKLFFSSFQEMNDTYKAISNLYNSGLEERFSYLQTLKGEDLDSYLLR